MKKILILCAVALMCIFSGDSRADSRARQERQFSCTDYCTKGGSQGKRALEDLKKATNMHTPVYDIYCKNRIQGGINSCNEACMDKGGLKSQILRRQSGVKDYILELMGQCERLERASKGR